MQIARHRCIVPHLIVVVTIFAIGATASSDALHVRYNSPLEKKGPGEACDTEICRPLLELIDGAERTIDFAIYGIRGQGEILAALLDAQKRGVRVRGVVDRDTDGDSYYKDTTQLEARLGSVRSDHEYDIRTAERLSKNKSRPYRFRGDLMHHKFFVVDGRKVWSGSANISDTGIGGYNANVIVLIDSPAIAAHYTTEFEQMHIDGQFHRGKEKLRKQDLTTSVGGSEVSVYFSPQGFAVRRGIIPAIRSASKSIDIAMFFLTHKQIVSELVKAHERGVEVRVVLDATGASNKYSKHAVLRESGVAVKVENWGGKMHMKAALIDESTLILGSMNWTSSGERNNDENTLIVRHAPEQAAEFKRFYEALWSSIPDRWLMEDPRAESVDSPTACRDGIDNDHDRKVDAREAECREPVAPASTTPRAGGSATPTNSESAAPSRVGSSG